MRECRKCGVDKPLDSFGPVNRDGFPACRACQAATARAWREKNPEKARAAAERARSKAKTSEHRETRLVQKRAYSVKYREENRERLLLKDRERAAAEHRKQWAAERAARPGAREKTAEAYRLWAEQNKKRLSEKRSEYRAKNREKLAEYQGAYRSSHRHVFVARQNERRTRELQAGPMDAAYVKTLLEARWCWYCDRKGKVTIDHVVPISRGGSNANDNLAPACVRCNSEKHDKTLFEWMPPVARSE